MPKSSVVEVIKENYFRVFSASELWAECVGPDSVCCPREESFLALVF